MYSRGARPRGGACLAREKQPLFTVVGASVTEGKTGNEPHIYKQ